MARGLRAAGFVLIVTGLVAQTAFAKPPLTLETLLEHPLEDGRPGDYSLREQAIWDEVTGWAMRSGLARRNWEINDELEQLRRDLDAVFAFAGLLITAGEF